MYFQVIRICQFLVIKMQLQNHEVNLFDTPWHYSFPDNKTFWHVENIVFRDKVYESATSVSHYQTLSMVRYHSSLLQKQNAIFHNHWLDMYTCFWWLTDC